MRARRSLSIAVLAGLLMAVPAHAETADQGTFKVYRHQKPLGTETFEISEGHDSLLVQALQTLTLQTADGEQTLERRADLLVSRTDFSLRAFNSTRTFQGKTIRRGIVLADTHYVAYREDERGGLGEARTLPPGRVYVMDSQLITMFDLICRSFQDRAFRTRDINLLALGPSDTMLTAHARAVGTETIRWGQKPVVAHKLLLTVDSLTTFSLWLGPQGRLLRLLEPNGGLSAERVAPPVKGASNPAPPPKPGG